MKRDGIREIHAVAESKGVSLYNEGDLLSWVDAGIFGEVFLYEEYDVNHVCERVDVGLCINSCPVFCRHATHTEKYRSGVATPHYSLQERDKEKWDEECPKSAWGISAYLAYYAVVEDGELWYYDTAKKGYITREEVFGRYLGRERDIWLQLTGNGRRMKRYTDTGDTDGAQRIKEEFVQYHKGRERDLLRLTRESGNFGNLRDFFGMVIVEAERYTAYLENRQKHHRVSPEIVQRIFLGDEQEAMRFISEAIRVCSTPTEYGNRIKSLYKERLASWHGGKSIVWEWICDNDNRQAKSGKSTFNKALY